MRILFLNPPFLYKFSREQRSPAVTKSGTIYYPMWLAYAAGYSEQNGHEIFLIDSPAEDLGFKEIKDRLDKNDFIPNLVVIATSTPSIYEDIKTLEWIKQTYTGVKAILVGTHPTSLPLETFKISEKIDLIALREYDETIVELANNLENQIPLDNIKGLVFKRDGKIFNTGIRDYIEDLDKLACGTGVYKRFLNYRNYFYSANLFPVITIITGRGCPFQCEYCLYPQTMLGNRFRKRSLENVIRELKFIKEQFPKVREIFFEDDTLTVDKERVIRFCNMLIENKLKIKWSTNSRAQVDIDTLKLMKRAGCRLLCVGYESGNQEILDNLNKNITLDEELQFSKAAKRAGIKVHGCFLFGYKGETKETIEKTINWAIKLNANTAQFFPLMVYPGTKAYTWADSRNLIRTKNFRHWLTETGLHNTILDSEQFTGEELVKYCDIARKRFYLRPTYIIKKIFEGVLHPKEGIRLTKAFSRFIKYLLGGSDV